MPYSTEIASFSAQADQALSIRTVRCRAETSRPTPGFARHAPCYQIRFTPHPSHAPRRPPSLRAARGPESRRAASRIMAIMRSPFGARGLQPAPPNGRARRPPARATLNITRALCFLGAARGAPALARPLAGRDGNAFGQKLREGTLKRGEQLDLRVLEMKARDKIRNRLAGGRRAKGRPEQY